MADSGSNMKCGFLEERLAKSEVFPGAHVLLEVPRSRKGKVFPGGARVTSWARSFCLWSPLNTAPFCLRTAMRIH